MPSRTHRHGKRYRRGYQSSYDGNEAARRHIQEADEFSREIGGTDTDVKAYFFSLPYGDLDSLLTEYGRLYGQVAEDYARETYTAWRSGQRRMSGLVAKRLFSLLPKRMPLSLKYQLAGNLWQHFGPSSNHAFVVGVDTPVDYIAATVAETLDEVVASYSIPPNLAARFDWLAEGDVKVKEQLLNYFRRQEKALAVEKVKQELPILQNQMRNHSGVTELVRSVLQVHKHQVAIRVGKDASAAIEVDRTPRGPSPSSAGGFLGWGLLALLAIGLFLFLSG